MEKFRVGGGEKGESLVGFLAERRNTSKRKAKRLLDQRRVFVNHQRTWMAKHRLQVDDEVEVQSPAAKKKAPVDKKRVAVLTDQRDFLVADKPSGLLTQGRRSVEAALQAEGSFKWIAAVHRLDKDTSGCLLLAKSSSAREELIDLFRQRRIGKEYLAIVAGQYKRQKDRIEKNVDGRRAVTHIRLLGTAEKASLVRCRIETGRTHQIRKHLASIGNPVAGDKRYGSKLLHDESFRRVPRQMLHAGKLQFISPFTGESIKASAPLPSDFRETLRVFSLGLQPE